MNLKLLYILAPFIFLQINGLVHAQDDISPKISIEIAIAKAKQYAEKNEIDISRKFIKKVEYHSNEHKKSEKPYWSIYWINNKITKGGGVELRLFTDGSIEEKYYK